MTQSLIEKQELNVSIITLQDRKLIMPSSALVEITNLVMPQVIAKMPKWFLGFLPWQGLRIPFISFEAASEAPIKINTSSKIAILKIITPNLTDKFFALLIKDTPLTLNITRDNLVDVVAERAPFELDIICIKQNENDIIARIPDILALEHLMAKTGVLH